MGLLFGTDEAGKEAWAEIEAENRISHNFYIKAKQQNEQITQLRIEKFRLENSNSRLYYQNEWLLSLNLILAAVLIYRLVVKKRIKS
jgi:hypothetical protein